MASAGNLFSESGLRHRFGLDERQHRRPDVASAIIAPSWVVSGELPEITQLGDNYHLEEAGYLTAYLNLWDARSYPEEALKQHENSAQKSPALSTLIRGFNRPGKRLLLVLDEAQVLAERTHADLAHALRASLDSRKQSIKVVFAGSSETTLRRMFGGNGRHFTTGRRSSRLSYWAPTLSAP